MRMPLAVLAVLMGAIAPLATAQNFPAKPVRVIITIPPGGAADVILRMVGPRISESLGQPLILENLQRNKVGIFYIISAPRATVYKEWMKI